MVPGLPTGQGQGVGQELKDSTRVKGQGGGVGAWVKGWGKGLGQGGTGFVTQSKLPIKNSKLFYMYAALLLYGTTHISEFEYLDNMG